MGYLDWLVSSALVVGGIICVILMIGLIILYPLGAVLALLILLILRAYIRWSKRHIKKHRRNT